MAARKKKICPGCGSSVVIKKGVVEQRSGKKQKLLCKSCGKIFSDRELKYTTYSPEVIMQTLCDYNKGLTLEKCSSKVNMRFGVKTYPRLISTWLKRFEDISSFKKYRKFFKKPLGKEDEIIFRKEFGYDHPFLFQYHKKKSELFMDEHYKDLEDYLKKLPSEFPDKLFKEENHRSFQLDLRKELINNKRGTIASRSAEFALKCLNKNKRKHDLVEEFMLCNDTSTLAVKVPVWSYPSEVPKVLKDILGLDKPLAGHIDLVQVKDGLVHVLDFNSKAHKEKPEKIASQLFAYSVALSVRTGKWLRNFRCAWFDEKEYYEFAPSDVFQKYIKENKNIGSDETPRKTDKKPIGKSSYHRGLKRAGKSLIDRLRSRRK